MIVISGLEGAFSDTDVGLNFAVVFSLYRSLVYDSVMQFPSSGQDSLWRQLQLGESGWLG